jgi:nitroreductase
MDALEALRTRRSIRRYKDQPVDRELIEQVVDCARQAATGRGEQPWEFVVITDADTRKQIADQTNAGKFIANAPVCIVVLCKETTYYLEDGSAATQNLMVAAHALGLGTCWVAGDKKPYAEPVRKQVGAPEGYNLVSLIALGHPDDQPQKKKRELNELLHWDGF